jgi:hypothetical protein
VWWQAISKLNGGADFHAHTKKELMEEIDYYMEEHYGQR